MTKFQYYIKIYLHYDPEICRFITIDDISYLNPDVINGVNLYAYCGNNPIMNVDPSGTDWWNPFSWDWESIAKIAVGAAIVVGLAVASVATVGTVSVVLAGAAIGAGAGFIGGGVSGVVSGGGLEGFANGALTGAITGAVSGAVATSGIGIGGQIAINAAINAGSYATTELISGNIPTLEGLIVNGIAGGIIGAVGGHGWTSAAMGGKLILKETAMYIGKNFLKHTSAFLGKKFFVKFTLANIASGALSGGYQLLKKYIQ